MKSPLAYPHFRRLAKEEDGASLLEFAILSPVLLLILFGIIEMGLILFAAITLEHAVTSASRYGKTGFTIEGVSREDRIREIINGHIDNFLDTDNITITTLVYDTFASVGQEEPYTDDNANGAYDFGETYQDINGNGQWDNDMGASGAGGPGDVVVYRVTYDWSVLTPIIRQLITTDGNFPLESSLAVRNEPFESIVVGGGT